MLHHLLLWALTPCLFIYLQDYFIYWCLKPKRTTRSRSRTISWGGSANLVSCPAAPAPGIICFQRLMSCKTLPCLPHMDNPPMHTHWSIILLSNFMSIVQFHPIADAFFHISPIHRPSHGSQFSAAIDLDWITSGSPFFLHHNISSWEETDKVSESHLWVNPDTIQNFSDCVTALWGVGWGGARLLYFAWRVKIDLALSDLIMQSRRRLTDFWHKLSDVDALLSMRLLHIHIY